MRRQLRGEKGATILEAAIVTPILLLLTFSIIDFASLFYVYLALENGASQATRYAVTGNQMDDPNNPGTKLSRPDSIKLAMRTATPTIALDDSAFAFSHLPVGGSTWLTGTGGPDEIDKVTITYTWNLLTPLLRPFFTNGQINLTVESAMKNEGRFQ
jgi:Flp pilus assembly protein TadG